MNAAGWGLLNPSMYKAYGVLDLIAEAKRRAGWPADPHPAARAS